MFKNSMNNKIKIKMIKFYNNQETPFQKDYNKKNQIV